MNYDNIKILPVPKLEGENLNRWLKRESARYGIEHLKDGRFYLKRFFNI
jgi:hypothetical protein